MVTLRLALPVAAAAGIAKTEEIKSKENKVVTVFF
jgi:hypothetical protein